jgi:hypothetical protein
MNPLISPEELIAEEGELIIVDDRTSPIPPRDCAPRPKDTFLTPPFSP